MKMTNEKYCLIFLYFLFVITTKTLQKELGFSQDDELNSWSQMQWDSILDNPKSDEISSDAFSLDDLNDVDKNVFKNEVENSFNLDESEAREFSEDEVFIKVMKGPQKTFDNKPKEESSDKEKKADILLNSNSILSDSIEASSKTPPAVSQDLDAENGDKNIQSNKQIAVPKASSFFDTSAVSNQQIEDLFPKSFIFNPNAQPQEQFQNCSTPLNETGNCRYLQHCLFPTIVSSLAHFMQYVCIIEERFIGVCCPYFPVSVITIQEQDEQLKSETNRSETDSNQECGVGTNKRIVGGLNADPKAWPWMVALLSKSRNRFFCGGVLINDIYVLTAAHCTYGIPNNEIIARLGEYNFKEDGEDHFDYAVAEIKRHGHYNRRNLRNDIALLKLEKPVEFNEFIEIICLPEGEKSYVGEMATLVGWGNIGGGGSTSDILQQASFPIISNEECSEGHGISIVESLICTGSEAGDKGACNGDSGGPLMLLDENNRWKVTGLVSWGRRGCNPEFPTVYTRVSHFLEWIKKHSE